MSEIVEASRVVGKVQQAPEVVEYIQKLVMERAFLFLENTRDSIAPQALDFLEQFSVLTVNSIQRQLKLKNPKKGQRAMATAEITACIEVKKKSISLCVVSDGLEWFDVSLALIPFLVSKPNPDSVLVLETMLRSTLMELQRKGFNVTDALRKFAKDEEDFGSLSSAERERLIAETQAEMGGHDGFGMIAADADGKDSLKKKRSGLFGRLFKSRESKPKAPKPKVYKEPKQPKQPKEAKIVHYTKRSVNESAKLNQGLAGARAYSKKTLNVNKRNVQVESDHEGQVCDTNEALYIKMSSTKMEGGPGLFVAPSVNSNNESGPNDFILPQEWYNEAVRFKFILHAITQEVFSHLPWTAINIYLNENSNVIAFNANGSMFFNLSYFVWNSVTSARKPGEIPAEKAPGASWDPLRQLDFWYPVVAHEVAHNLTQAHGATHNHYMESYIQTYLPQFKKVSRKIEDGTLIAPQ